MKFHNCMCKRVIASIIIFMMALSVSVGVNTSTVYANTPITATKETDHSLLDGVVIHNKKLNIETYYVVP